MIRPAERGPAWSAAFFFAISSWWAAVKRVYVSSEQARAIPSTPHAPSADDVPAVTSAAIQQKMQCALIASGIFGKADAGLVSELIQHIQPVHFPAGHVVFAQGDTGSCLYMILSGEVKVVYRHADDREVVLDTVGAADVFGEVTPFDYTTRDFTATTATEVSAVAIDRDQLLVWMIERPEITPCVMRLLARRADDPPYRVARGSVSSTGCSEDGRQM